MAVALSTLNISSENVYSPDFRINGYFNVVTTGTWVGALTLQQKFASDYSDVDNITSNVNKRFYGDGIYRIICKTGKYTSGTIVASLNIVQPNDDDTNFDGIADIGKTEIYITDGTTSGSINSLTFNGPRVQSITSSVGSINTGWTVAVDDSSVTTNTDVNFATGKKIIFDVPAAKLADTRVAGLLDTIATSANIECINGTREIFAKFHSSRFRQPGTLTKAYLYCVNHASLTGIYVKIWRYNGSTYDLVGKTENFRSQITSSAARMVTFSTPITGILEGDYYSILLEGSGSASVLTAYTGIGGGASSYYRDSEATNPISWTSQTAISGTIVPLQLYMAYGPQILFIGDSITGGKPGNLSFIETDATDRYSTGTIPYSCSNSLGCTFQNMGFGGNTTTAILTRFVTNVVNMNPTVVVIEAGINDLGVGISAETTLSNYRTMFNYCRANNIIPIVLHTTPWSGGSKSLNTTSDGAEDGTTFINSTLSSIADYYKYWWVTIGSETRQVSGYNESTKTVTVSPAFSGQVTSGTAFFMTALSEIADRMEQVADLCKTYNAAFIDLTYTLGQNNSNAAAALGNLWDVKSSIADSDDPHLTTAGYTTAGQVLASKIGSISGW